MPRALVAIALVVAVVVAAVAARPSAAEATVRYVAPVDAPVVDAFRPPPTPFAAGNRGLEYATAPGTVVRAAADGEVVFAGQVGGSLHVTVLHADGIRTSYSFLATIAVHEGDDIRQGDVVGTAGPRLFFGARVGDEYVDPALLLGGVPPAVHLVPLEGDGVSAGDERRALAALSAEHRWPVAGALTWLRDRAAALPARLASSGRASAGSWRAVLHEVLALDPVPHVAAVADAVGRWRAARQSCTPPDRSPPPTSGRRIAVLVGGLGSSSADAAVDTVDTAALGYAPADVIRFSYAGGRTPDPTDGLTTVPATAYT
ncbi:MAG TPA: M23 family metallopeptidase, partial [Acidimicrobiales bacterium]